MGRITCEIIPRADPEPQVSLSGCRLTDSMRGLFMVPEIITVVVIGISDTINFINFKYLKYLICAQSVLEEMAILHQKIKWMDAKKNHFLSGISNLKGGKWKQGRKGTSLDAA